MKRLSIYIHVPFCKSKCYYCDFLSVDTASEEEKISYTAALLNEIELEAVHYYDYEVSTVFIGGGTPSVLPYDCVEAIMRKLREHYRFSDSKKNYPEVTIEVNPGTITGDIFYRYRDAGINRLSIGLQSANESELRMLGRSHTFEEFLLAYHDARGSGFTNINIDLISSLPSQSLESWNNTLNKVISLNPEHISVYGLIAEAGTLFYEKYFAAISKNNEAAEEEMDRLIYYHTKDVLQENNYIRYEISNHAKPGYECRHNLMYWKRGDYAGFGLGASSMVNNRRWSNISDLKSYIMIYSDSGKDISLSAKEKCVDLSLNEQIEEYMFLNLRLTEGVNKESFRRIFNQDIDDVYSVVLEKLSGQKLININSHISLTTYGIDISNYVLAQFLF